MMDSPSGTPEAEETPVPSSAPEAATVPDPSVTARPARARLRSWSRGWPGRLVRWGAGALAVTVAVLPRPTQITAGHIESPNSKPRKQARATPKRRLAKRWSDCSLAMGTWSPRGSD